VDYWQPIIDSAFNDSISRLSNSYIAIGIFLANLRLDLQSQFVEQQQQRQISGQQQRLIAQDVAISVPHVFDQTLAPDEYEPDDKPSTYAHYQEVVYLNTAGSHTV